MEFHSHLQFAIGIDYIFYKNFAKWRVPDMSAYGWFSITVGSAQLDIAKEMEIIGTTRLQCA